MPSAIIADFFFRYNICILIHGMTDKFFGVDAKQFFAEYESHLC
jgi:hypothetical protein